MKGFECIIMVLALAALACTMGWGDEGWASEYDNFRQFGQLTFSVPNELELSDVSFGEGLPDGLDMSETWITKGEVRWGENIFRARLTNTSSSLKTLIVRLEPSGPDPSSRRRHSGFGASATGKGTTITASVESGKTWDLGLPYNVTSPGRQQLRLTVKDANSGETIATTTYPINVPQPIQLHQDQFYYYPDETRALFDIACPDLAIGKSGSRLPLNAGGRDPYLSPETPATLNVRIIDESSGQALLENHFAAESQVSCGMDISTLAISTDPVRQYRCQVDLVQGGTTLASASATFGRLERPHFPPQPPVEKVEISPEGLLLVNGKPFFPIIASLRDNGPYERASAMGFNAEKTNLYSVEAGKARIDEAWQRNVYFVISDFQGNPADREAIARFARTHPGVLMHVGSEVAYGEQHFAQAWPEDLARRSQWDPTHPMFWEYEGGSGSWYARALGLPPLGDVIHLQGLVADGPLGRVTPRNFDLERAAATHPELIEVVVFPWQENRSEYLLPGGWLYARSFPWQPLEKVRAGVYLAIIHGARGLYYYAWTAVDEARGLVLELRALYPIILSASIPRTVGLLPARNHIDVLQKEYEGKTYLITCNRAEEVQQVEFRLPNLTADTTILRRFEPLRPIERTAAGKGFKDTFQPYEVHVYEIG